MKKYILILCVVLAGCAVNDEPKQILLKCFKGELIINGFYPTRLKCSVTTDGILLTRDRDTP